ncbi:histone-lysine N-methyltransferase, H3 lysine-9 specific SUVH5-like [Spinacia oleracea]|uniref:Histone-lysine N-methyltransferase, H3 lysine-9 specific SUVH5-like n=1 Tax=Spinacia oleracea TaxID=3562 RepID=A0ABM3R7E2_SPIOL|nr:histone-lysine N-methyltransferase, H3 lysine-9 specific SUVH5-like [Spinacia oleracea]
MAPISNVAYHGRTKFCDSDLKPRRSTILIDGILESENKTRGTFRSTKTIRNGTLHATRSIVKRLHSYNRFNISDNDQKGVDLIVRSNPKIPMSRNAYLGHHAKMMSPTSIGLGVHELTKSFVKSMEAKMMSRTSAGVDLNDYAHPQVKHKLYLVRCLDELYKKFSRQEGNMPNLRIDLKAWRIIKKRETMMKKLLKTPKNIGPVPGVNIGDTFDLRLKLVIMGIHSPLIDGIDYTRVRGQLIAISIVATDSYYNDLSKANEILYTGVGGTFEPNGKYAKDQELKRGNLALKNSMEFQNVVRVVRGMKNKGVKNTEFIYDGLYKVVACYKIMGPYGKMHFHFKLMRCPAQEPIIWNSYYC